MKRDNLNRRLIKCCYGSDPESWQSLVDPRMSGYAPRFLRRLLAGSTPMSAISIVLSLASIEAEAPTISPTLNTISGSDAENT